MKIKNQINDSFSLYEKIKVYLLIKKSLKTMNTSKLASRKLWVTIGGATLVSVSTAILLSMGVSEEATTQLVGWVAKIILGYAGAQGLVDVASAIQTGKNMAKNSD
jgi:hypothetical protein